MQTHDIPSMVLVGAVIEETAKGVVMAPVAAVPANVATVYDLPLRAGDAVKMNKSEHRSPDVPYDRRGQIAEVIGEMRMVEVKFEDGTIAMIPRDNMKLHMRITTKDKGKTMLGFKQAYDEGQPDT